MTSNEVAGLRAALLRGVLRPKINRIDTHLAQRMKRDSVRKKKGELANIDDEQAKQHLANLRQQYESLS